MTRIDRITHMETLFDKSEEVVRRLDQALEDFAALQPAIAELEERWLAWPARPRCP